MVRFFSSLARYFLMVLTIACLVITLNNCGITSTTSPSQSVTTKSDASPPVATSDSKDKININTAIETKLEKLEDKLSIRELPTKIKSGRPYGSIDELVSKKILTQEQFDRVKELVTVEAVVLTGEAKDVDYLTKLGLMKGHMIVAGQLLDLKLPKQAEPHLGHPIEEIYGDIVDQLSERKVADFKDVLAKIQELVKTKSNDPQVKTSYEQATAAVDKAIAALPDARMQSPAFVLKAITGILETAAAEYTGSISGGKISEAIEYQDSRGFVEFSKDTLLKNIQPKLDPKFAADLTTKMDKLFKAWPSPVPPATPVVSADEVASQIKAIQQVTATIT